MANVEDLKLAYIRLATPKMDSDAQTYVGGLMVVDYRGMPVAFHYTEPIQPNRIQQILYGQSLSRYIRQEVMLGALLKGLNTSFDCVVVDDNHLLTADVEKRLSAPVVRISEPQSASRLGEAGTIAPQGDDDYLVQPTPEANPIRVQTVGKPSTQSNVKALPEHAGSDAAISAAVIPNAISNIIAPLASEMDLAEPLKRIDKALEEICREADEAAKLAASKR